MSTAEETRLREENARLKADLADANRRLHLVTVGMDRQLAANTRHAERLKAMAAQFDAMADEADALAKTFRTQDDETHAMRASGRAASWRFAGAAVLAEVESWATSDNAANRQPTPGAASTGTGRRCNRCGLDALVAVLADGGLTWERDLCASCGASWFNDPPRPASAVPAPIAAAADVKRGR